MNEEKLVDLQKFLSETVNPKKFGLRDGYIYSHVIKQIKFELFVTNFEIALKYPIPNIGDSKINQLTQLVFQLNDKFKYESYKPMEKNMYSIWRLDTRSYTFREIADLLIEIEGSQN